MLTILLAFWLIFGVGSSSYGASLFLSYSNGYKNNLNTIGTWVAAGWSSADVASPSLAMRLFPSQFYYNSSSVIELTLRGFLYTNRTETVVFSFASPFSIVGMKVAWDESTAPGSWSVYKIGSNASGIYYTIKANNCSSLPCYDNVYTDALFTFNNLPSRDDHGHYAVVVPFGGGEAPWLIHLLPNYTSFQNDLSKHISFMLGLDSSSDLTSSFPPIVGEQSFSYAGKGPVLQEFNFGTVGNSTLTIRYDNSPEINDGNLSLTFGLFFLGIGVPLLVSFPMELYRDLKQREKPPVTS